MLALLWLERSDTPQKMPPSFLATSPDGRPRLGDVAADCHRLDLVPPPSDGHRPHVDFDGERPPGFAFDHLGGGRPDL
jgi:hypothetical protein